MIQTGVRIICGVLVLLVCGVSVRADENEDMAFVLKVLTTPTHDPNHNDEYNEHAADLKRLGDSALPLLARNLHHWDGKGRDALFTMLAIDADKATPYIFATLPDGTHSSVQEWAFRVFNRRLLKGEVVPHTKEIHDAAVRCLAPSNQEVSLIETFHALSLTGNSDDFALLEEYHKRYANKAETEQNVIYAGHDREVANAAEASLARLGHPASLASIEAKLKRPVKLPEDSDELVEWIKQAGFSGDKRFVPLLCKHQHDPPTPPIEGGMDVVVLPSPGSTALSALGLILKHWLPEEMISQQQADELEVLCSKAVQSQ